MANEIKQLGAYALIIVLLSATVVIGSAVIGGFSKSVRDSTVVAITDFNVSVVGTPASLAAYAFPQSLTGCFASDNISATLTSGTDYTIGEGWDENDGTLALITGTYNSTNINCTSLTYLEDSTAQGSADLFNIALIIFGTFIGIIALSLIGKTIIELFNKD